MCSAFGDMLCTQKGEFKVYSVEARASWEWEEQKSTSNDERSVLRNTIMATVTQAPCISNS